MKHLFKKIMALLTVISVTSFMCIPAFADEVGSSLTLTQASTFVVSVPGSLTFDTTTYQPNISTINMTWANSSDLSETINLTGGASVNMYLSACYTGYSDRPNAFAEGFGTDNILTTAGILTIVDSKTVGNTNPNKLYCKVGMKDTSKYPAFGRPIVAGIGSSSNFGSITLKTDSSTEYEDVIGGMTISGLYIDSECTIPATKANVRAGNYTTNIVFDISIANP